MRAPLLLVVALLAAACAPAPSAPATPTGGAPAASAAPDARASLLPLEAADPARLAALEAAGADQLVADLLATSAIEATRVDARTVEVRAATPLGVDATVRLELVRGEPGQGLLVDRSSDDGTVAYSFPVDGAGLPTDVTDALAALPGPAIASTSLAFGLDEIRAKITGYLSDKATDTAKEAVAGKVERYLEKLDAAKGTDYLGRYRKAVGLKGDIAGAVDVVKTALEIQKLAGPSLDELELLRRCAVEPTDPLTKRSYAQHPDDQRKILDRIEAIRAEVREQAGVLFMTLLLTTGSSLIAEVPWLGTIMEKGGAFVSESLTGTIGRLMDEARGMVTGCGSWRAEGEHPILPGAASGVKCGGLEGEWAVLPKKGGVDLRVTVDDPAAAKRFRFTSRKGTELFTPSEASRTGRYVTGNPLYAGMATVTSGENGDILMELFMPGGTEIPWVRPDPPMTLRWVKDPGACAPKG